MSLGVIRLEGAFLCFGHVAWVARGFVARVARCFAFGHGNEGYEEMTPPGATSRQPSPDAYFKCSPSSIESTGCISCW